MLDLHDLDLSRNLISNWETVLNIISQLHKLRVLWLKFVDSTDLRKAIIRSNLMNIK
jgi:Leucine-rich repeat (LRR) protein